jgi:hypothetical protein
VLAALVFAATVAPAQTPAAKQPPSKQSSAPTSAAKQPAATSQSPAAKGAAKGTTAARGAAAAKPTVAVVDTAGPAPTIYREEFEYSSGGRRDPFYSLLATNELRPTMSDLKVTGILFDPSGRSMATLRDLVTNAQYRVTTGSTLGRMRVSSIRQKIVVFTIDEFGTTRQDSLVFGDTTKARPK